MKHIRPLAAREWTNDAKSISRDLIGCWLLLTEPRMTALVYFIGKQAATPYTLFWYTPFATGYKHSNRATRISRATNVTSQDYVTLGVCVLICAPFWFLFSSYFRYVFSYKPKFNWAHFFCWAWAPEWPKRFQFEFWGFLAMEVECFDENKTKALSVQIVWGGVD